MPLKAHIPVNQDVASMVDFCEQHQQEKVLYCNDFQQNKTGLYSSKQLVKDWPNLERLSRTSLQLDWGVHQDRVSVKPFEKNNVLKVFYPKDSFGPWNTGATWKMRLPELKDKKVYEQVSVEYKVMFKKGFLYDRPGLFGGKLPGLMGGKNISGGKTATGRNGFTSRLMWGQLGRGLGYLYYPDMKDDKYNQNACPHYGLDHELCVIKRNKYFTFEDNKNNKCLSEWARDQHEFKFKTEKFYKIKQHLRMNSLPEGNSKSEDSTSDEIKEGNRDGELKIWLDDKLVVDCTNVRFRDIPELGIDSFIFSTFFGGNTPESSAHPTDEVIYFDDFVLKANE